MTCWCFYKCVKQETMSGPDIVWVFWQMSATFLSRSTLSNEHAPSPHCLLTLEAALLLLAWRQKRFKLKDFVCSFLLCDIPWTVLLECKKGSRFNVFSAFLKSSLETWHPDKIWRKNGWNSRNKKVHKFIHKSGCFFCFDFFSHTFTLTALHKRGGEIYLAQNSCLHKYLLSALIFLSPYLTGKRTFLLVLDI